MKTFLTVGAIGLVAIWLWNRYQFANAANGKVGATNCTQGTLGCYGPADPTTGDYNPLGTAPGTVSFGAVQTGGPPKRKGPISPVTKL